MKAGLAIASSMPIAGLETRNRRCVAWSKFEYFREVGVFSGLVLVAFDLITGNSYAWWTNMIGCWSDSHFIIR
jgi:hypothetical protein